MKLSYHFFISIVSCFVMMQLAFGQENERHPGTKVLDKLIAEGNYSLSKEKLQLTVDSLRAKQSYYYLTDYIYYTGKINLELYNQAVATKSVQQLIHSLVTATDSLKVHRQAQLELATYWELIGNSQQAYNANLEALKLTSKWKEATQEDLGVVENNLGTLANRNGDIATGLLHHKNALKHYEAFPNIDKKRLYILYNSLGGSYWMVSKIDSALLYYEKAEKALALLEPDPINLHYRPAILQNNIAGIYASQGNLDKALKAMKQTIDHLDAFMKSNAPDAKKESAREFLFQAIENYAGIYKDIGNLDKAKTLIEYAYQQKQRAFDPDNPELFKAKVLMGQINLALKDYQIAEKHLDNALVHLEKIEGGNEFWAADAHYYKAGVNEALGNIPEAKTHFLKAEAFYEMALQGAYDELYLDFVIKASHFYAKNQEKDKALQMAQKAYDYVKANQGVTTSFEIQQALNLGDIYYELGDYKTAKEKGLATLELLKKRLPTQTNPQDSTQVIFYQPQAILLTSKANYQLESNRSETFLKTLFKDLKQAIAILEQHKSFVGDDSNVSILIENNTNLFEFAKQVALELHALTKDTTYMNEVVSLHESILYNHIRSRLDSRASMGYVDVPNAILKQEQDLKLQLKQSLKATDGMGAFFKANSDWDAHLETLKKEYPKYYKLKYASISKSLDHLSEKLPDNTTLVRYLFVGNQLNALVVSKSSNTLIPLNYDAIKNDLVYFDGKQNDFNTINPALHKLYQQLWQPIAAQIKTKRVIIVPDRALFNLSFEMLTTQPITSFKEMATHSLLAKHIISYNYSLFLIDKGSQTIGYKEDFVAFVPEFDEQMKKDYKIAIRDSIDLDMSYLTLLPQPFTKLLAQKSTRMFSGTSFLNENSTEHIFKNSAKEHKIIHIGTHAESNNITPELSRLVFAKSTDSLGVDDSYLYTYEIYNTNLSSNLAILTACETGKPTYQAGEGMISLAHAFNYAGSESILTSLWKIDEQSSAKIIESFYKYIKKGMPKDEALQQAKLDYISQAQGRTIHPEYWAGLVLIGDASPIQLQASNQWIYWLLGVLAVCLLLYFVLRKRSKS